MKATLTEQVDGSGCPNPPADSDGDGYVDSIDACPLKATPTAQALTAPAVPTRQPTATAMVTSTASTPAL
ncbi:MAG: hypothetical protein U0694_04430 [Anaerolineae bacterium]